MDDLRLIDDLHRLVPRLAVLSRHEQVSALRYLVRQLGGVDGVVVPHHGDWHVEAVDAFAGALLRRLQLAAAADSEGVRRGALRAAREARRDLDREIKGMELVAELDRLSDADAS